MNDENFMRIALDEAKTAFQQGEIPIGAVIVNNGNIISRAHNTNRYANDPTQHAEINAIRLACSHIKNERLNNCELYITKEPCAMCAGAIVHARISRVIIAAEDTKYGACGTVFSVCGNPLLNHVPKIEFGLLRKDASELLSEFFAEKRNK